MYFEKTDKGVLIVRFKPIKVNGLANSIIEDISDVRIFLTATLPSVNTFIFNLGLDSKNTLYINVTKDLYPVENRIIHYTDVGYMTYKKKEKTLPLMVEDIVKVGDETTVKVIGIDNMGRINLSRRAMFETLSGVSGQGVKGSPSGDYPFRKQRETRPGQRSYNPRSKPYQKR